MRELSNATHRWTIRVITWAALILLVAPTLVVVIASLTDELSLRFPPRSYSIRWYTELWFDSPEIIRTATESLNIAIVAALTCIALGTLASLAIARSSAPAARILDAYFMSPMILPSMAFGLALLLMFSSLGVNLSTWTLIAGHVIICTPYVIRMVSAAVQQLSQSLLDCSASLGASPLFTFFHVTLPLIKRAMIAGGLVAFLTSFDHVPVSLMLADPRSETLPIHLWTILETNLDVRVASVCGVIVALTLAVAVLFDRTLGVRRAV
jgi:putative spermidine/putrescine transport system permease protein